MLSAVSEDERRTGERQLTGEGTSLERSMV